MQARLRPRLRQVQGAAKRAERDGLPAHERIATAGATRARTVTARRGLARRRQSHGFAAFFRIRPMLGPMFTAVGRRTRADAAAVRLREPSRWRSRIGRFACKAAHPGYIGWEEFMANQRRLADNVNRYEAGHTGVPRKRLGVAAGHRNLRPLWTSHEPALHGTEWRLSGLLLPVRSRPARRRAVPGSARLAGRRAR